MSTDRVIDILEEQIRQRFAEEVLLYIQLQAMLVAETEAEIRQGYMKARKRSKR